MRHVQTHTHKRHEKNLTAREGERERERNANWQPKRHYQRRNEKGERTLAARRSDRIAPSGEE